MYLNNNSFYKYYINLLEMQAGGTRKNVGK